MRGTLLFCDCTRRAAVTGEGALLIAAVAVGAFHAFLGRLKMQKACRSSHCGAEDGVEKAFLLIARAQLNRYGSSSSSYLLEHFLLLLLVGPRDGRAIEMLEQQLHYTSARYRSAADTSTAVAVAVATNERRFSTY